MALRGVFKDLKNDAGALISAAALTTTDYSETLTLGGMDSFGVMVDVGTVAHQTSGTLNITPQFSYDSGTSWVSNPAVGYGFSKVDATTNGTVNMGVQQITASSEDRIAYWRNPFPSDADIRVRFALTVAGAGTHSFALTSVKYFGRSDV
jgi:hypothetical protein